ncbi:hypothetical protein [Crossiella sp. CA198]|uniref:hypothetical protein n=1 Tax=Crossiella sp. CA198 TaxID=3455607 RepID=UPI003F8D0205
MNLRTKQALRRLAAQDLAGRDVPEHGRRLPWEQPEPQSEGRSTAKIQRGTNRLGVLVAAAVAVGVLAVSMVMVNQSNLFAEPLETPPLLSFRDPVERDPAALLLHLAARAASQPVPRGAGAVFYADRREWQFTTAFGADSRYLGVEFSQYRQEIWRTADGTGRSLRRELNPPSGSRAITMDGPLKLSTSPGPAVGSADPEVLKQWFLKEGQGRTTAQWFENISRDWGLRAGEPAAAAALLRILANQSGMTIDGMTTDRAGRRAVAVSTPTDRPGDWFPRQRQHLLIDPETGLLLATELVGLAVDTDAVGAPVRTPATIGFTLWLSSALVPDTHSRP